MTISSRSSAAVFGSRRMPKSSIISSGTAATDSMYCLRLPSRTARERLGVQPDESAWHNQCLPAGHCLQIAERDCHSALKVDSKSGAALEDATRIVHG